MHSVLFVTGNANKLAEVTSILDSALIQVRNAALDIPEIQGTLEEIARDKCRRAAEIVWARLSYPLSSYSVTSTRTRLLAKCMDDRSKAPS